MRKAKAKQKIHGHKRKKKKQDRPVKIQKLSEEETAQLARIKTEVLESESLLDPTSGTIVEKQSGKFLLFLIQTRRKLKGRQKERTCVCEMLTSSVAV